MITTWIGSSISDIKSFTNCPSRAGILIQSMLKISLTHRDALPTTFLQQHTYWLLFLTHCSLCQGLSLLSQIIQEFYTTILSSLHITCLTYATNVKNYVDIVTFISIQVAQVCWWGIAPGGVPLWQKACYFCHWWHSHAIAMATVLSCHSNSTVGTDSAEQNRVLGSP